MNGCEYEITVETGFTFCFVDRSDDHLRIIISSCDVDDTVVVNMTTKTRFSDTSCIIHEGEHSFVHHDTCISYFHAEVHAVDSLNHMLHVGNLEPYEKVSEQLYHRILDGAQISRRLPGECRVILEDQGLI